MASFKMHRTHEHTMCRLCLCSGGCFIDIFEEKVMFGFVLKNAIEELLQLKVVNEVRFPWLVCPTCLGKLTQFRLFKHQCVESQIVFDNRVKRGHFPKALGSLKTGLKKDPIKEEENADILILEDVSIESDGAQEEVDNAGGPHEFEWQESHVMEKDTDADILPQIAVGNIVYEDTEMVLSHTGGTEEKRMAEEDGIAEPGTLNVKEVTSSIREKPVGSGEESTLRMLLLNGWSREQEPVEANSAQGEVVLSDNVSIDDGLQTQVVLKLEGEGLDREMQEGVAGRRKEEPIVAQGESERQEDCGSALRRLLVEVPTMAKRGKVNPSRRANSVPSSGPASALNRKRKLSTKKVEKSKRQSLSKPRLGDGVTGHDQLGDLEVAPGNAAGTSGSERVGRPSEDTDRNETGVGRREDVKKQGGNVDPDTCTEVYYKRGILKSLLLDHTWSSSLKGKHSLTGSKRGVYPIPMLQLDDPGVKSARGSLVGKDTCSGSPAESVSTAHSPVVHKVGRVGGDVAIEIDLSDDCDSRNSLNLSEGVGRGKHPHFSAVSRTVVVGDQDSSTSFSGVDGSLSGSGNVEGDCKGLSEKETGGTGLEMEVTHVVQRSSPENSVASVSGELKTFRNSSPGQDLDLSHSWKTLVESGSAAGAEGVENTVDVGGGGETGTVNVSKGNEEGKKSFRCLLCADTYPSGVSLRKHMRASHPEKCKKCTICSRILSSVGSMQKHLEVHEKEKELLCDVCGRTFTSAAYLKMHLEGHNSGQLHGCPECQEEFSELWELQEHVETHSSSSTYSCVFCDRTFGNRESLKAHFRSHNNEGKHRCEICQRSFPYKQLLTDHLREHVVPFRCKVCRKEIQQSKILKHIKTHEPYDVW